MKATFWDKRSKKYDDNIKKHDSIYEKTIDRTKSLLNNSDVVLDFACASGEMSLDIAPHVQRVHGIDQSIKMIELANQKARDRQVDNINFDQIDAFDQRLVSNSFSDVVAFNIFHLLDDVPKVLARLNDLLPTGGLLISQTPCLGERSWFFRGSVANTRPRRKAFDRWPALRSDRIELFGGRWLVSRRRLHLSFLDHRHHLDAR